MFCRTLVPSKNSLRFVFNFWFQLKILWQCLVEFWFQGEVLRCFFFEFLSSIRNSLICCGILIKRRHSSICFVKVRRQGKMFRSIFFISDLKLEIILFFIFFFLEHCNSKRSNFDLFFWVSDLDWDFSDFIL